MNIRYITDFCFDRHRYLTGGSPIFVRLSTALSRISTG